MGSHVSSSRNNIYRGLAPKIGCPVCALFRDMQPCRDRFWKTSPQPCGGPVLPPQAFQEQRTRWTLTFLPTVLPPVVAGPPKPCRTLTAPSHQHRFCLSSGPQTCPPLSRSLAPAVACLPRTAPSPTTFSQSISDATEMQTWPHSWLPGTFGKAGPPRPPPHTLGGPGEMAASPGPAHP